MQAAAAADDERELLERISFNRRSTAHGHYGVTAGPSSMGMMDETASKTAQSEDWITDHQSSAERVRSKRRQQQNNGGVVSRTASEERSSILLP